MVAVDWLNLSSSFTSSINLSNFDAVELNEINIITIKNITFILTPLPDSESNACSCNELRSQRVVVLYCEL